MKTNNKCAAVRLEKSRLLAALAVLAVAFVALAAIPAVADDSDAADTVKEVKDLTELNKEIQTDNFNLKLTADITTSTGIPITKSGTLDLNNHSIRDDGKTTGSFWVLIISGEVTIKNGSIEYKTQEANAGNGAIFAVSKFTLEGVTIASEEYGVYTATNGNALIKGCTITSKYSAVSGNGTQENAKMTIDGGTYTSLQCPVLFFPSTIEYKVSNATLTGVGGVDARNGTTTLDTVIINLKGESGTVGSSGPASFLVGVGVYQWANTDSTSYGAPVVKMKNVTVNAVDGAKKDCDVYYGRLTGAPSSTEYDFATATSKTDKTTGVRENTALIINDEKGQLLYTINSQYSSTSSVKIDLTSNAGKLIVMKGSVLNCDITVVDEKASFKKIEASKDIAISKGSIVIDGDYTTSGDNSRIVIRGNAKISGTVESGVTLVVERDVLAVIDGTLTIDKNAKLSIEDNSSLKVNGKLIVKENTETPDNAGSVEVKGTLDIGEKGSLVVGGNVKATGSINNSGTIVLSNKDATIPVDKITGTGEIDNSEIAEEGTIGGNWNTVTTFTQNQTITLTGDTVLKAGSQIIFEGVLVIPSGITLTIEDGAQLIVRNTTGKILNDGNIVVMSDAKHSEAPTNVDWNNTIDTDGGLQNLNNGNIINNGSIVLDYSDDNDVPENVVFNNDGILTNAGDITVGQQSYFVAASGVTNQGTITVNGMFKGDVDNESVVIISGIIADNVKINNKADGASVQLVSAVGKADGKSITVKNGLTLTGNAKKEYIGASETSINVMKNFSVGGVTITSTVIENDDESTTAVEYDRYNVLNGTMAISQVVDYESAPSTVDMFTLDAKGNTYVAEDLSLPAGIVLSIAKFNDSYKGTFTVDGSIVATAGKISYTVSETTSSGTTTTTKQTNSIGGVTIDANATLNVNGSIVSATKLDPTTNINATYYEVAATTNPVADAKHVYTTFIPAVESGAKKINVYGKNAVPADVTIPSGVTVSIEGELTVSKDSTVSVADGAKMSGSKVIVKGTLYFAAFKTGDKIAADGIESEVIIQGDKDRTYTNLAGAISKAASGATITLRGTATIDSDLTIPEGIKVDTNANRIEIGKNATLTVDGELFLNGTESTVTLAPEGEFDKAGAIAVNGVVSSADSISGKILKGTTAYTIPGAYFEITVKTTTTYYVSPVEDAAAIISTVDDQTITIAGEKLTIGDVSFTGADAGATIIVDTALTATSIALDNATLSVNGKEVSLVITNSVGTVELKGTAATGFKVSSNGSDDSKKLAVEGGFTVGTATGSKDKMNVSGTVTFNDSTVNKITVAGTAVIAEGKRLNVTSSLTVTGTVEVSKNATLDSDGLAEVQGFVAVAEKSADEPRYGTFSAEKLYIGTSKKATIGAGASVTGNTSVTEMLVAAAGTTVPEAFTSEGSEYVSTEYYIDNGLYMTVYAPAVNDVAIDGMKASKDNAESDGWTTVDGDESKKIADTDCIGDKVKVYALFDYNIYMITLTVGSGIENVAIDGNLVTGTEITGLRAGTHTVTYTLENGYSGTATLTVNSEKQSGLSFTMSGKDYNKMVDGEMYVNYDLQLSGVTASGYTPVSPVTPSEDKNDGLTITDYLLIVLVVLIVIMAVIVAMRLMRS